MPIDMWIILDAHIHRVMIGKETMSCHRVKVNYPKRGRLALNQQTKHTNYVKEPTAAASIGQKIIRGTEIRALAAGVGVGKTTIFISGGLAIPFVVGLASGIYGAARTIYQMIDRAIMGNH
jgi:hypothetical protein